MKTLFRLALVLGLAAAGGYVWYLQSVHFVLLELKEGVETPNLEKVDPYVDYKKISASFMDYTQARAEIAAEEAAGGVAKDIVGGLAGIFRSMTKQSAEQNVKDEIRATIAEGRFREVIEEFQPAQGFAAVAGMQTLDDGTKRVSFQGKCEGGPAEVAIDFARVEGGKFGMKTYQCVGMSKANAQAFAKTCHDHAKKKPKR